MVICLLLASITMPVSAESQGVSPEVLEYIHSQILEFSTRIELTDYDVSPADTADLQNQLLYAYSDIWYLEKMSSASIGGKVQYLQINYASYTKEDVEWVEKTVQEGILAGIDESWTPLEKVLYVHDGMCETFQYDIRLFFPETADQVNRSIYQLLKEGTGVCQAYAGTFKYIMDKLGIPCRYVSSDDAAHQWNMVQLDGEWYHIDVTQDDPVLADAVVDPTTGEQQSIVSLLDRRGYVAHDYFLKSDAEIEDGAEGGSHYNWYVDYYESQPARSDRFEGSVFTQSVTGFVNVNGAWYFYEPDYENEKAIISKTTDFVNATPLWQEELRWGCSQEGLYYPMLLSGLGKAGDCLVYNTDSAVKVWDTKTGTVVKTISLQELAAKGTVVDFNNPEGGATVPGNVHIYGSCADGGMVWVQASEEVMADNYYVIVCELCADGHIESDFITVKPASKEQEGLQETHCLLCGETVRQKIIPILGSVKRGDCNGDGSLDTADLVLLKKRLAGLISVDTDAGYDCNLDGSVDTIDLTILKRSLAGLDALD